MDRFTISLEPQLARAFDELIARRGYGNRSEAVRDILRRHIESDRLEQGRAGHCVAAVSYVYNHHERSLAERVVELQHAHHDLTIASMHVHLDHDECIETLLLRGRTTDVRRCAEQLIAERGVRHGHCHLVPVETDGTPRHSHPHGHGHTHLRPST